jgi:hypothetical protein
MFQRVLYGSIQKETVTEAQVRKELEGHYTDVDAIVHDMIHNPRTPVAKTTSAVYWYGA